MKFASRLYGLKQLDLGLKEGTSSHLPMSPPIQLDSHLLASPCDSVGRWEEDGQSWAYTVFFGL